MSNVLSNELNNLPLLNVRYEGCRWFSQEYSYIRLEDRNSLQIIFQLEAPDDPVPDVTCVDLDIGTQFFLRELPFRVVSIKDYTNLRSNAWILDVIAYPPTTDAKDSSQRSSRDKMLELVPLLEKILKEEHH